LLLAHHGLLLVELGLNLGDHVVAERAHVVLHLDPEPAHDLQHRLARHAEVLGNFIDAGLLHLGGPGHFSPSVAIGSAGASPAAAGASPPASGAGAGVASSGPSISGVNSVASAGAASGAAAGT